MFVIFFLRRKRLLGNLGNRTLFVTVWQMIFSILQYKQYSVFFHSPELKWNLHHASRHSAAFSVIPLFYWPSVIFMQQHYSVHSSESHTFTIFYSFIQIPDCKLSTATPYLHHLFFSHCHSLFHIPLLGPAGLADHILSLGCLGQALSVFIPLLEDK